VVEPITAPNPKKRGGDKKTKVKNTLNQRPLAKRSWPCSEKKKERRERKGKDHPERFYFNSVKKRGTNTRGKK